MKQGFTVVAYLTLLTLFGVIYGCSDNTVSPPSEKISITGSIVMGPADGAFVDVFSTESSFRQSKIAGPLSVDTIGHWRGTVATNNTEPYCLIASGGSYTDLSGQTVSLDPSDEMYGFIHSGNVGIITPLSHGLLLAAEKSVARGLSPENALNLVLGGAYSAFGFEPAITVPSRASDASLSEKKYMTLLGGMATLLTDHPNLDELQTASPFDLMIALSEDLSNGKLDGVDAAGNPVMVDPDGSGTSTVSFPALDENTIVTLIDAANSYAASVPELNGVVLQYAQLEFESPEVPLVHMFSHESAGLQSSAFLGIWMFKPALFSTDAIAQWVTQPSLRLLEPINVLWVDYSASSQAEARQNVEDYLVSHGFSHKNYGHSTDYFGLYHFDEFVPQWPLKNTWVDASFLFENNHGRIFGAHDVGVEVPIFYTLGAFSREGNAVSRHSYVSFDRAQRALLGPTPGWEEPVLDTVWGNVVRRPPGSTGYHTDDHRGVAIIIRSGLIGTWDLVTVNGQSLPPGVWLRWVFTASTITVTSDLDCVEVLTYSASEGILSGTSVVSRTGSQCGDDDDSGELGTYSVEGNTLTVTITDPEIDPPTAVFVFSRH